MAGGTKVLKGPIQFVRFNIDGTIDRRKFRFNPNKKRGSYKNPFMKNGDLVFVDKSIFTTSSEIIQEFTSPFSGLVSTYALYQIIND